MSDKNSKKTENKKGKSKSHLDSGLLSQEASVDMDTIADLVLDELITAARDDFYIYVKLLAPYILPDEFVDGRHIEVICEELQKVCLSVENPAIPSVRLQLFLPPGSMKSKLASNLFPSWCLGRNPHWCFLAIGQGFDFAVDNFGRPTKDLVDLEQYRAIFPDTILRKDVQSAGRWDTTRKGRFVVAGVGQGIAGRRAHISICDDVLNEQTGKLEREKINKWYQKGLRTRLLPGGAEIIINTRWHMNDLSGFTQKLDEKTDRPWKIVSIPALCNEETKKLLWREGDPKDKYDPGTSFWPEFWPTEELLEKKETFPPNEWNALYLQSPTPEEGAIIKKHQFKIWEEPEPPPCKYIIISMDTAFSTKETADYSAYSVWGVFDKFLKDFEGNDIKQSAVILLSAGKGRWEFGELCTKAQELNNKYQADFFIIEDKASGQSLIQEMRKRDLPIVPFRPEKDKVFRMHACSPYFQAGRVFIPKGRQWAEELVEEVCSFPAGAHDDMADTVSQAILWLVGTSNIDNEGYSNRWDDDDDYYRKKAFGKRGTYWSALTKQSN